MTVKLGSEIDIKMWAATPANSDIDSNGIVDSVAFMHDPLATDDLIITSRDPGTIFYPLTDWDDVSFADPNPDTTPGYTNQSLWAFTNGGVPDPLFNSAADTVQLATFSMHTTTDTIYLYEFVCPFISGYHNSGYGILWGLQGALIPVYPEETFSCLFFVDYYAGDANGSGQINGLDVVYMVSYFRNTVPAPTPILAGDANGDCATNGLDVVYLVNYFRGTGPKPFYGDCY
jgi:hypothetical protein